MKSVHDIFILGLLAGICGCAEYGGGAVVVPDVTFVANAAAGEDSEGAEESGEAVTPGTFTGSVVLKGGHETLKPLFVKGTPIKDPEACGVGDIPDERLKVGEGNGVENVFVYLPKAPKNGKKPEISEEAIIFDQEHCQFFPHCLTVPVGQTVKVLSKDPVAHNTHTYPKKNQSVNSGVAAGDREGKLELLYRKAEAQPFPVKCDYHTWMTAYHLTLDHPYFAVTDENGKFTIPDLPPGKHNFVVWHEAADGNFIERKLAVEIKSGEPTEMQIGYPAEKLKL